MLRIGQAAPLGFGATRKEPRIENGIEMTGGRKSVDAEPTHGGGVHKAPKKKW